MINRHLLVFLLLVMVAAGSLAQEPPPVPTLVPPTPVPFPPSLDEADTILSESSLVQIQASGRVRIGILYNEPPFGELNIRGEVVGYDAALGRSLAEAWGIEAQFVQVTRQNAIQQLKQNGVDMVIAAQVNHRDRYTQVEFSHTYFIGSQTMLVRADDGAQAPADLNNRRVGVVLGTPAEEAIAYWQRRTGATVAVQTYLTINEAVVGLVDQQIDAVVDRRYRLRELVNPDLTRVLEGEVQPEPFAIALRRQDIHMRNLVNRTLQYLAASGRMADIHDTFFPSRPYPIETIPRWDGLGEEPPTPAGYGTDIPYPQFYTVPQIQSSGVLRVAGVPQPIPETPGGAQRIAQANAQLAEQIAQRWGVRVAFVAGSEGDPVGAVERGEADLAMGVRPSWDAVNRVDFTTPYLLRGKRMLVEQRDDYNSLGDLRGRWVGVFASEPGTDALVRELGATVNANLNVFTITRDEDAAYEMLTENNIDVIFGDSIRLLPHYEANRDVLKFADRCATCDPWYTREYLSLAVPRNDLDFRLLVAFTLQEIALDGTLGAVLMPVTVPGEDVTISILPGSSDYLGFALAG